MDRIVIKLGLSHPIGRDRNWLEFLSVLDATFSYFDADTEVSEDSKTRCQEDIAKTHALFSTVAEQDGLKDRTGPLGLLELEKRARKHGLSTGSSASYPTRATFSSL